MLATMVAFFGLFLWGTVKSEPYPAPIFPGFGSIPDASDIEHLQVRMLAFESSGERQSLTAAQAFEGAFDSFHPEMLESLVVAGAGGVVADTDLDDWARDRVSEEFGWQCADSLEVVEVAPGGGQERILARFEFERCS